MRFAPRRAYFHPITPVSSSRVFWSDRVIMLRLRAARCNLADDHRGPFDQLLKCYTEREKDKEVQPCCQTAICKQVCGDFDCLSCCFQALQTSQIASSCFISNSALLEWNNYFTGRFVFECMRRR